MSYPSSSYALVLAHDSVGCLKVVFFKCGTDWGDDELKMPITGNEVTGAYVFTCYTGSLDCSIYNGSGSFPIYSDKSLTTEVGYINIRSSNCAAHVEYTPANISYDFTNAEQDVSGNRPSIYCEGSALRIWGVYFYNTTISLNAKSPSYTKVYDGTPIQTTDFPSTVPCYFSDGTYYGDADARYEVISSTKNVFDTHSFRAYYTLQNNEGNYTISNSPDIVYGHITPKSVSFDYTKPEFKDKVYDGQPLPEYQAPTVVGYGFVSGECADVTSSFTKSPTVWTKQVGSYSVNVSFSSIAACSGTDLRNYTYTRPASYTATAKITQKPLPLPCCPCPDEKFYDCRPFTVSFPSYLNGKIGLDDAYLIYSPDNLDAYTDAGTYPVEFTFEIGGADGGNYKFVDEFGNDANSRSIVYRIYPSYLCHRVDQELEINCSDIDENGVPYKVYDGSPLTVTGPSVAITGSGVAPCDIRDTPHTSKIRIRTIFQPDPATSFKKDVGTYSTTVHYDWDIDPDVNQDNYNFTSPPGVVLYVVESPGCSCPSPVRDELTPICRGGLPPVKTVTGRIVCKPVTPIPSIIFVNCEPVAESVDFDKVGNDDVSIQANCEITERRGDTVLVHVRYYLTGKQSANYCLEYTEEDIELTGCCNVPVPDFSDIEVDYKCDVYNLISDLNLPQSATYTAEDGTPVAVTITYSQETVGKDVDTYDVTASIEISDDSTGYCLSASTRPFHIKINPQKISPNIDFGNISNQCNGTAFELDPSDYPTEVYAGCNNEVSISLTYSPTSYGPEPGDTTIHVSFELSGQNINNYTLEEDNAEFIATILPTVLVPPNFSDRTIPYRCESYNLISDLGLPTQTTLVAEDGTSVPATVIYSPETVGKDADTYEIAVSFEIDDSLDVNGCFSIEDSSFTITIEKTVVSPGISFDDITREYTGYVFPIPYPREVRVGCNDEAIIRISYTPAAFGPFVGSTPIHATFTLSGSSNYILESDGADFTAYICPEGSECPPGSEPPEPQPPIDIPISCTLSNTSKIYDGNPFTFPSSEITIYTVSSDSNSGVWITRTYCAVISYSPETVGPGISSATVTASVSGVICKTYINGILESETSEGGGNFHFVDNEGNDWNCSATFEITCKPVSVSSSSVRYVNGQLYVSYGQLQGVLPNDQSTVSLISSYRITKETSSTITVEITHTITGSSNYCLNSENGTNIIETKTISKSGGHEPGCKYGTPRIREIYNYSKNEPINENAIYSEIIYDKENYGIPTTLILRIVPTEPIAQSVVVWLYRIIPNQLMPYHNGSCTIYRSQRHPYGSSSSFNHKTIESYYYYTPDTSSFTNCSVGSYYSGTTVGYSNFNIGNTSTYGGIIGGVIGLDCTSGDLHYDKDQLYWEFEIPIDTNYGRVDYATGDVVGTGHYYDVESKKSIAADYDYSVLVWGSGNECSTSDVHEYTLYKLKDVIPTPIRDTTIFLVDTPGGELYQPNYDDCGRDLYRGLTWATSVHTLDNALYFAQDGGEIYFASSLLSYGNIPVISSGDDFYCDVGVVIDASQPYKIETDSQQNKHIVPDNNVGFWNGVAIDGNNTYELFDIKTDTNATVTIKNIIYKNGEHGVWIDSPTNLLNCTFDAFSLSPVTTFYDGDNNPRDINETSLQRLDEEEPIGFNIINCTFKNNTSSSVIHGHGNVVNCLFVNNYKPVHNSIDTHFYNCTFVTDKDPEQVVEQNDYAIMLPYNIYNSFFSGHSLRFLSYPSTFNGRGEYPQNNIILIPTDKPSNADKLEGYERIWGENNEYNNESYELSGINENQPVCSDFLYFNYHPKSTNPPYSVIDKGNNDCVFYETDLEGKPRIFNDTVDVGCYEYIPYSLLPPIVVKNELNWVYDGFPHSVIEVLSEINNEDENEEESEPVYKNVTGQAVVYVIPEDMLELEFDDSNVQDAEEIDEYFNEITTEIYRGLDGTIPAITHVPIEENENEFKWNQVHKIAVTVPGYKFWMGSVRAYIDPKPLYIMNLTTTYGKKEETDDSSIEISDNQEDGI